MGVFATQGLVDILVEFAADREPQQANVPLAATPASDLAGDDSRLTEIDDETPIITHFYLPDAA
ncbi:MAG: hypothetical protein ABEH61_00865, partial [Haloarculaceae archaeon]